MRFRLTVLGGPAEHRRSFEKRPDDRARERDVSLSCDVTVTAGDIARALLAAGLSGDPRVRDAALQLRMPVTLLVQPGRNDAPVMLDPGTPVVASGLRSGWFVEAAAEHDPRRRVTQVVRPAAYAEVLTGAQRGITFSLLHGVNTVGRAEGARIRLIDPSVSRHHAVIDVGERTLLRDCGSANGSGVDGAPDSARSSAEFQLLGSAEVWFGKVRVRVFPEPIPHEMPHRPGGAAESRQAGERHTDLHGGSPQVRTTFPAGEQELPALPQEAPPARMPILAMLAPMLLGLGWFLVTRSPMSLMMVAFSPLMMIGSWLDSRLIGRRRSRRDEARFVGAVSDAQDELEDLREREILVRQAEAPTLVEVAHAITHRAQLLWSRRPEHSDFLQLRLGSGALPSRTDVVLPPRADTDSEHWQTLRDLANGARLVEPVPVCESLDQCGSIGLAGSHAAGLGRSLVIQLSGLHSPADLLIAAVIDPAVKAEWAWLAWLPHVDPVGSPLGTDPLACGSRSAARLVNGLEALVAERLGRGSAGPHQPVVVLVVDTQGHAGAEHAELLGRAEDHLTQTDVSRLIALSEHGPAAGVHLLWAAPTQSELPGACRTFVTSEGGRLTAGYVRSGETIVLQTTEELPVAESERLARLLAPVEDRAAPVLDESDLPREVPLRDLHSVDPAAGADAVLRAWRDTDSLHAEWTTGSERSATSLAAVVGQSREGAVVLDLHEHGPHALVGGTTGSGKSEFLQTWIMSLAASVSPDRVTFLLVDYKGGAAFAECVDLPHTVGLVTDLGPALVRRALTSLRAELRHREILLAAHGAKDLRTMERRGDPATPPVLVIVIDEFAALAADVPEFVTGVVDIAQRGRSLGLHLIMATQRPAGVISDNLRSNTNLRIALRMADETDSVDVIRAPDAAYFDTGTPGRGAIALGPGQLLGFQVAYLGGHAAARAGATKAAAIEIRDLALTDHAVGRVALIPALQNANMETVTPAKRGVRDIEALRDALCAAAQSARLAAPRRPWLDELPSRLPLPVEGEGHHAARSPVVVGLRDLPAEQARQPLVLDLDAIGSLAVIGASGTGKTSALITIAVALSGQSVPVHIYGIDATGGPLPSLVTLPTVGAVAGPSDDELMGRVLRRVRGLVVERGAVRAHPGANVRPIDAPRTVLLIDGLAALRQSTEHLHGAESPIAMLREIMANGRAAGVHVVLTADRPAAIPSDLAASLQQQFVLRLANALDYGLLGVPVDLLEGAPAGRGVVAGTNEVLQFAWVGEGSAEVRDAPASHQSPHGDLAGLRTALGRVAEKLRKRGVGETPVVRNAPLRVALGSLPQRVNDRPVIGVNTSSLGACGMPERGLVVIAGPPGSGVTTAIATCVSALGRGKSRADLSIERTLFTATVGDGGLRSVLTWETVVCGVEDIVQQARRIAAELVAELGSGLSSEAGPQRRVIVVEGAAELEGTPAMAAVVELARAARRALHPVLFEFELGAGTASWELLSALRQPGWGVVLQPDEADAHSPFRESFGRVHRRDFPPGRGFAVEAGRATPVQVAEA